MEITDKNIREAEERVSQVAEANNLSFVVIYGSVARGDSSEESDIDIAVMGEEEVSFKTLVDLNNIFIDVFGQEKVDVKSLHKVTDLFRYEVIKDGFLLYGDKKKYQLYKIYAFRRYCENKKLSQAKEKQSRRQIEDLLSNK